MKKVIIFTITILAMVVLSPFAGIVSGANMAGASGIFSPDDFTFAGELVQSFQDTILEEKYINPELTQFHTIVENIVATKKIGYLGLMGEVIEGDEGCDDGTGTDHSVKGKEKIWEPVRVKIHDVQCLDETYDANFMVWLENSGLTMKDFTTGRARVILDFLIDRIQIARDEDILRIVWFNDKDASCVDDSIEGYFTSGTNIDTQKFIDGFWKQIFAIVTADSDRYCNDLASRNGQSTYKNQKFTSTDTANQVVTYALDNVYTNSDTRLSDQHENELMFLVTKSVYDQYKRELSHLGAPYIAAAYDLTINGAKVLHSNGIPVIKFSFWDRMIKKYFDNGTSLHLPHRIVLAPMKGQFLVGVDAASSIKEWKSYYWEGDEKVHTKGRMKIDAKIRQDFMLQTSY
jgi:hypothetical protein